MDQAPQLPAIVAVLDGRFAPSSLELSRTTVRRLLAAGAEPTMAALADMLDPEAVHVRATEWDELRALLCTFVPPCVGVRDGTARGLWSLREIAAEMPQHGSEPLGVPSAAAWRPSTEFLKIFLDVSLRFRSGNCVPVERAMLPRHAWRVLRQGAVLGHDADCRAYEAAAKAELAARHPGRSAPR